MTHIDIAATADHGLLKRVRDNMQPTKTLAAAIHDGTAALGISMHWHEADVLAEAVRGHYETTRQVYRVSPPEIPFPEGESEYMLREMLYEIHEAGLALVSKPVETTHRLSDVWRLRRTEVPISEQLAAELIRMYPFARADDGWPGMGHYRLVLLTGRCRALVGTH